MHTAILGRQLITPEDTESLARPSTATPMWVSCCLFLLEALPPNPRHLPLWANGMV